MKRSAKLLMLLLALVVLASAWLLTRYMTSQSSVDTAEADGDTETIDLSAGLYEDITALSWSYGGETVSLTYDAEADAWVNADDASCPIDSEAVEPLVLAVSSVAATVSVSDVTDFEQYGLDDPALTVMAGTEDHVVTYEIGGLSITGEYYLRVDGGDTVYTETGVLAPAFQVQLDDMLALESAPEDVAQVTGLSVQTDVESFELAYEEPSEDDLYGGRYEWFRTDTEEKTPVQTDAATTLCESLTGISFLSCETWNAQDLSAYGLDEPQGTASVTYTDTEGQEQTFTLEFGAYAGSYVYVRLAGSSMVYLASGSILDGLMYVDWDAMTPLDVCAIDMDSVTAMTIELGGHSYEVTRLEDTTETENEDGELEEVTEVIYSSNGWVLDTEETAAWLETISQLQASSLADTAAEGREELLRVTFQRDGEDLPETSLVLWSYDSTSCLCVVNEETALFVSRETVEELVEAAEALLITE